MPNFRNLEAGEIAQVLLPQICGKLRQAKSVARWVFGNASVRQTPKKRYAGKPLTFVDEMIFELVPPCNLHQFAVFIGAKYRCFFKVF